MPLLKTVDGGKLLSDADPRTVGPENCTRRLNIRREDDAEVLLPGWVSYGSLPAGCIYKFRAVRPNGDRAALAFTSTAIYQKNTTTGAWDLLKDGFTTTTRWEAVNLDGWVLFNNGIDLPHVWDWVNPVIPAYEMREQGIVRVGTMWTAWNFLFMAEVTEFGSAELVSWMNGSDPYGNVPDGTSGVTKTPYRVVWSDKPTEWGLSLAGTYVRGGGSTEIVLPFPCASLSAGDTINFTETEADGDTVTVLLTEEEIDSISGNRLTMVNSVADSSTGLLTRSNFAERIIGYDDLQGDGSTLLKGGTIGKLVYIVRESAIILGEITDDANAPFFFQEVYRGSDQTAPTAPSTRRLTTVVKDDSLIYYSKGGWYEFNLRSQRPQKLKVFDVNDSLLGVNEDTSFFLDVTPEQELWIFLSDRTLIFDYEAGILGEVDVVFESAALVDDPNSNNRLLLLSSGADIFKFDDDTYTRDGETYEGVLEYGWNGDKGNMRDTIYRRYIPVGIEGDVYVSLSKAYSGKTELTDVITEQSCTLGKSIQLYLRAQWMRDTITIKDGGVRLIGREVDQYASENRVRGWH